MATQDIHSSDHDGYVRGTMDISDHVKTWLGFWAGAKWGLGGILIIVIFLAIFRTHNG